MKRFKYSLLFGLLIIATAPYHNRIEKMIAGMSGLRLANYFLLGLLLALFLIALFKCWSERSVQELTALLLAILVLSLSFYQKGLFPGQKDFPAFLHICEFFLLGFLVFKENRKAFSLWPFVILAVLVIGFEGMQVLFLGQGFSLEHIWNGGVAGFCGLIVGYY